MNKKMARVKRALDGIKVIDLSQGWGGPGGTMLLADQGADVIKIEPLEGEQGRNYFANPPIKGLERGFLAINRSKRGIALDLKTGKGREILYRLAKQADVFVHNFRQGVPERLGIHYEKIRRINSRLIYASLSSFGSKGPYAGQRAYDVVIQAMSGIMARQLPDGTPMPPGIWLSDCSTMIMLAYAITLALFVRERTGLGQQVETSLFNQALFMQLPDLVRTEEELRQRKKSSYTKNLWDYHTPYRCRDGKFVVPIAMTNEQWKALCRVLGKTDWGRDDSFGNAIKRFENGNFIHRELSKLFIKRSSREWMTRMRKADIPHAPVLSKEEVFSHPQAIENQMVLEVVHPTAGPVKMIGIPFQLSKTPGTISRPSPLLGEHSHEILKELGYTETEIRKMGNQGVVKISQ